GNSAELGGGIFNVGTLTVTNSTIAGNSASGLFGGYAIGGGIFNVGTLTVTNSTIADNSADLGGGSRGGGIYNIGAQTVTNCPIAGNPADLGAGIFDDFGATTLANTIVAGNSKPSFDYQGRLTSLGHNLLGRVLIPTEDQVATDLWPAPPLLGPL